MVVKKMRASAEEKKLDVHIEAQGVETFPDYLEEYDLFLLGPQIRFKKDELQKLVTPLGKKVEVINMVDYGMVKGDKILADALALLD
jgi:PTS system cellobiose-specific IIB component